MAQAYPPAVLARAKELWTRVIPNTMPLSTEAVAKVIRTEFGVSLTKKTVGDWVRTYGWSRSEELAVAVMPPTVPQRVPASGMALQGPEPPTDLDWEKQKLRFLGMLAGVAENCLAIEVDADGKPKLMFRDDDSRIKVGMAAVEVIGKINSGKFDPPEAGDRLPQLRPEDVQAVVAFFLKKGSPEPRFRGRILDATFTEVESGSSDGQDEGAT